MKKVFAAVAVMSFLITGRGFAAETKTSSSSLSAQRHTNSIHLHEAGIILGYGWADLKDETAPGHSSKQDDYSYYPIIGHFGWDVNSLVGLSQDHPGTLQFAVQPFINPVSDPEGGVEVGAELTFKYSYPVWERVAPYLEFGAGPMYFGVDTYEQGEAGFSFSDHVTAGIQYFLDQNKAVNVGYRYRHISNLGTRDDNGGINASTVIAGLSIFY